MSDDSKIEWTDATWNPIRGCSRVSEGCRHCYAERVAARFSGPGLPYEGLVRIGAAGKTTGWNGTVRMVPEHLADPLRWRRPRRVFVNSMSDLFHEGLPDGQRDQVLAVMLLAPRHTFQCLTKRAAAMRRYLSAPDLYERVLRAADAIRGRFPGKGLSQVGISNPATSPPSWIWWGVSVENQAAADERIPELLRTPAAVRWISAEPLLGEVDVVGVAAREMARAALAADDFRAGGSLDWIVAGCESGSGARPCDVAWLRSLRDQCVAADVPFFLKQAMHVPACIPAPDTTPSPPMNNGWVDVVTAGPDSHRKAGGVIGLPYLDGSQHKEFPRG